LPKAIRSDNGTPFACTRSLLGVSKLSAWWLALGVGLERSRPGCPQDNGAHERMHLDVMREIEAIAKRKLKGDNAEGMRQASFDRWRKEFNEERPHEALGMKMPKEVYTNSPRSYRPGEFDLDYEGMETRVVQDAGTIKVASVRYFVSTSMSGWDVGLKLVDGHYEIYFGTLLLGRLEPETESFHPVVPPEKASPKKRKV
jgi:putative transposase